MRDSAGKQRGAVSCTQVHQNLEFVFQHFPPPLASIAPSFDRWSAALISSGDSDVICHSDFQLLYYRAYICPLYTSAETNPSGCLNRFSRSDFHEMFSSDMKVALAGPLNDAGGSDSLMISAQKIK